MRRWSPAIWLCISLGSLLAIIAVVAALSGGKYVIPALAVSLIPLAVAALLVTTTRSKTAGPDHARHQTTAAAGDDPYPGMGIDEDTPLGDTTEHSDAERVATPARRFGTNP